MVYKLPMVIESTDDMQGPDASQITGIDNALLEQLAHNLREGLFILDREGRLAYLNPTGERILGWKNDALLGAPMHDRIHFQNPVGEPIPAEECPVHKSVANGQTYHSEEDVFIHRDGRLLPVSFTATPLWRDGRITGSVTTFKEIGHRKEMEREIKQARDIALETSRLKSEFLANMSHEIRTPINGVIGMTDLLLDTKLNKEQKELAGTARESAQALLTVIDDILDFSGLEAGKMEIDSVDFRIKKMVEEVAELHASQAQKKNLDLSTNVSNKIPSMLQGDPARLRQVLLNLLSNAIKFTKKGSVTIRARLVEKSKNRVIVRFSVIDTGIGIPKSARHRLFQPFTQVDGSSSRAYGGTGLGLSISNRLVELMGGEIGLESRKGKGSTFWFTVPLARTSAEETELEPVLPQEMSRLRGVKTLVVDPQQTSQTLLLNRLLSWNLKGTAVESAEEALAFLQHESATGNPCELVLIAASLGNEENDFTLARTITNDRDIAPCSLVSLTGSTGKKQLEKAREAGYVAHLGIPLQLDRLRECLLSLFNPRPDRAADRPARAQMPAASQPLEGGLPILLAEDNAMIQKVEQTLLNRLGYAVHPVANGKEAHQFLSTHPCSLVLMDCQMPVMDGFQASRTIRENKAISDDMPIIGMTANIKGDRERCLAAGMNDLLAKPLQIETLAEMLEQWLPVRPDGEIIGAHGHKRHQPPIQLEKMADHFDDDKKIIREFLDTFIIATGALLKRLETHVTDENSALAMETAHELKGSSDNMGAFFLADLGRRLEKNARSNNWNQCRTILMNMKKEYQRCKRFVDDY